YTTLFRSDVGGAQPQAGAVVAGAADEGGAGLDPVQANQGQPAVGTLQGTQALLAPVQDLLLVGAQGGVGSPRLGIIGAAVAAAAGRQGQDKGQQGGQGQPAPGRPLRS